ncbi:MAG: molecular chaperone DnaJ [Candidatus Pacebacteria bacterium]|nr:molecular chaperone DnaJ [Candidatus Paceibacterota bacterium]
MADYYSILGISKNASQEDIKKAYRKLAHQHHPDKGGDEKKFKEINEAYQILGNEEKRRQYDQFGHVFEGQNGFGQNGPGFDFNSFWQTGQGGAFDFNGLNFEDLFGDFFGGGSPKGKRHPNKGRDLEINVAVDLEDTLKGLNKRINFGKFVACDRCDGNGAEPGTNVKECFSCRGTGQVQQMQKTILGTITRVITCPECKGEGRVPEKPCNVCKGEGRVKEEGQVEVFIPAGVDNGQIIKIDGKGDAGKRSGKTGDLYIKVSVNKHPLFDRKGDDLFTSLFVSFAEAALGGEVAVPTIENKTVLLKVPSGMESGKIFRVGGKGIPHFNGWGRGDMYAELLIKTPKKLTKRQREILTRLKEEGL